MGAFVDVNKSEKSRYEKLLSAFSQNSSYDK